MQSEKTCGNCDYWQVLNSQPANPPAFNGATASDRQGECREKPPGTAIVPVQGLQGMQPAVMTFYPQVPSSGWCGQHSGSQFARDEGRAQMMGRMMRIDYDRALLSRKPKPEEMEAWITAAGGQHAAIDPLTGQVTAIKGGGDVVIKTGG